MISAAFTDGKALICAIPSKRSNGVYLVRVEPTEMELIVSHDCPAIKYGGQCKHIAIAVTAYELIQWWEPKKKIVIETRRNILQPDWKQVPVPKTLDDKLREWINDAS